MARDQRAAALKAWATRRARAGGKARILPSGQRAMATNFGGRAKSGPAPTGSGQLRAALRASMRTGSSGLGSLFHKRGLMAAHAMRLTAQIGAAIKARKRRMGGVAEREMTEWAHYAENTARELAHEARRKGYGR